MVSNILMLLLFPESTFILSVQTEKKKPTQERREDKKLESCNI